MTIEGDGQTETHLYNMLFWSDPPQVFKYTLSYLIITTDLGWSNQKGAYWEAFLHVKTGLM